MAGFTSLFSVSAPKASTASAETAAAPTGSPSRIEQAFSDASKVTGLPFDYFMTTAMRESSLDVRAAATTSSARGPFQFIEQTWLSMVHDHGAALGYADQADAIERQPDGRYTVSSPDARDAVLDLRYDPSLSAVMSGRYLQENARSLEGQLGRPVSYGEGYMAHVMGAGGAVRLISLAEASPQTSAASVFPVQADANKGLFFDRSGSAVSVKQLYDRLASGFPTGVVDTSALEASGPPVQLKPDGFDDLPTQSQPSAGPDTLGLKGLFVPNDPLELPLFASLYAPLSGGQNQLAGVPTVPNPTVPPSVASSIERAAPRDVGLPLDLNQFVSTGQLSRAYGQTSLAQRGTDLVPPV